MITINLFILLSKITEYQKNMGCALPLVLLKMYKSFLCYKLRVVKSLFVAILIFGCLSTNAQGVGDPSYIRSVFFRGGSSYVSSQESKQLLAFLDSIPNVHNFLITVHSHTDDVGGSEYNELLSEARSQSVIKLLLKKEDIKKESIEIKDFGLFNPTYDNSTNYGRRMNRRVDIIFWLTI
ncbi:hypothetical protein AWN68_16740 [Roseivirga echinicomitans]|uniref:OmpA-like domain-containing protein n=1 Tax=Roseivirga echinicomitans TaxID=296218 RepID=A0A150XPX7_9BACT|nr:hypothetical protein AWN68_16740 [Roseivirga echinicomitans]